MPYNPTTFVKHSWAHPPKCLSGVVAKPLKSLTDEHDAFARFAISCACGAKDWHVLGHSPEPDLLPCPLTLKCNKCGQSAEIFDIEKHGYDAEPVRRQG